MFHRSSMPLSLWLVPDQPSQRALQDKIKGLATAHGLPDFKAHLTLIGTLDDTPEEAMRKLQRLRASGVVPVAFNAVVAGRFPDDHERAGEVPWSQSAAACAEESPELLRIKRLADSVFTGWAEPTSPLGSASEGNHVPAVWAPPLGRPHVSLAYGNDPSICEDIEVPKPICCDAVAVFDCTPATAEGSTEWKEIARVSLHYDPVGTPRVSMRA